MLEEDQANITQTPEAAYYSGRDRENGPRRMDQDTTRMDKSIDIKVEKLGQLPYTTLQMVSS